MVARRLAILGLALQWAGCDPSSSLLVDAKTDLVPGEEFARVRTIVRASGSDRVLREQDRAVDADDAFLAGVRVAELEGLGADAYVVRVSLADADGRPVLERSVLVTLSQSTVVTVVLTRSCRGVTCPGASDDPEATECLGGRCVPPECVTLGDCSAPACQVDADCAFPAECVTPVCEEGVCLAGEAAGACPAGQYCDPELGCRPRTGPDDPVADGGMDAGVDAGAEPRCTIDEDCDDGVSCTTDRCEGGTCTSAPDDAACTEGDGGTCVPGFGCQYAGCTPDSCVAGPCETARCEGDTCVVEPTCAAGSEECCGGACVPVGCDDGNPCTDDSCGASGCEHVPNTAACDDGVFCNGADTCSGGSCSVHAGDPCSGASVCDEGGDRCVGCTSAADCPDPVTGPWSSCTYADGCAESGTRERTVTTYACVGSTCQPSVSTETEACSRDTDGASCGSTTYGSWSSCGSFTGTCDETGTRTRTRTDRVCAGGTCTTQDSTDTGSCVRDTDGVTCMSTSYGAWSSCGGFSGTCDETGTRSRSRTDYTCASGSCQGSTSTETGACSRNTDGTSCGTTSYGAWSSCGGFSGTCDETGTRSRSRTDYTCANGTCDSSTTTDTGSCSRNTDGTSCGTTTYSAWSACGGFDGPCDETGTETRTRTDYTCGSGTCDAVETVETRSCSRNTDGDTCASPDYTSWSTCSGYSSTCDETGTQSRTRTDYSCSSGACVGSDSPESRSCTRNTDGNPCVDWGACATGTCSGGACDAPGSCSGRCCEPNICVCSGCACP